MKTVDDLILEKLLQDFEKNFGWRPYDEKRPDPPDVSPARKARKLIWGY